MKKCILFVWFRITIQMYTLLLLGSFTDLEEHRADFNFYGHFLPRLSENDQSNYC